MARSTRFRQLELRCRELRKRLLPARLSATGVYSPAAIDRTRGYRLLVHAEMESYLEDRVREVGTKALADWKAKKKWSKPLLGLSAFARSACPIPDSHTATQSTLGSHLSDALTFRIAKLLENHGVRTRNLMSLLLPVGVEESDLDPVWVNAMDSFGVDRGAVAHNSGASVAIKAPDPGTEIAMVKSLLKGLLDLDRLLTSLSP